MKRNEIQRFVEKSILNEAATLFYTNVQQLQVYPGYEGAANIVFDYQLCDVPMILRISHRHDRTHELIMAELEFIKYFSDGGLQVSQPIYSRNGNLIETLEEDGHLYHVCSFIKGRGMRVPDNNYQYRDDSPIEEYFYNWGVILGKMHALAVDYLPSNETRKRPDWFELHAERLSILNQLPPKLGKIRQQIHVLLDKIREIPRERGIYGLIHGDFNDGNFTVDYDSGEITVFDFDDCCYFFYVYELASAWEGGIGRVMFRGLGERVAFMDHYMRTVMAGYKQENTLPIEASEQLPLFIKLIQVEEFLHFARYLDVKDQEIQSGLKYKIKCIENGIPYMGFFDPIFDPRNPFRLLTD